MIRFVATAVRRWKSGSIDKIDGIDVVLWLFVAILRVLYFGALLVLIINTLMSLLWLVSVFYKFHGG
jgi:hypothetical protein